MPEIESPESEAQPSPEQPAVSFFAGGDLAKSMSIKPQNMARIQSIFADSQDDEALEHKFEKLETTFKVPTQNKKRAQPAFGFASAAAKEFVPPTKKTVKKPTLRAVDVFSGLKPTKQAMSET